MLPSHVESYNVPVERMVRATISNGAGKKDDERKNICKRKKNPPGDMSHYGIALMSKPQLTLILSSKLFFCSDEGCHILQVQGTRTGQSARSTSACSTWYLLAPKAASCISAERRKRDPHQKDSRGGVLPSVVAWVAGVKRKWKEKTSARSGRAFWPFPSLTCHPPPALPVTRHPLPATRGKDLPHFCCLS